MYMYVESHALGMWPLTNHNTPDAATLDIRQQLVLTYVCGMKINKRAHGNDNASADGAGGSLCCSN